MVEVDLVSESSQLVRFLSKIKFAFSAHSFTRLAAARWQDSMSRGQKSSNCFIFPQYFFVHVLDNVEPDNCK